MNMTNITLFCTLWQQEFSNKMWSNKFLKKYPKMVHLNQNTTTSMRLPEPIILVTITSTIIRCGSIIMCQVQKHGSEIIEVEVWLHFMTC